MSDAVFELYNRFSNDTQLAHLSEQLDIVFDFFGVRSLKMRWFLLIKEHAVRNKNTVNLSQLSSDLADMRRAYRVLVPFQEMMKSTLLYIKEQYRFNNKYDSADLYPFGTFADKVISTIGATPISVEFNNNTFFRNVDFAGYSSVWFGGPSVFSRKRKHNQVVELWGFIIPDDSLIMDRLHGVNDIFNVQDAENASGYIVLFAAINNDYITEEICNVGDYLDDVLWLAKDDEFEGLYTIRELLSSRSGKKIMSHEDEMSILKRYRLEEFADKQSTDQVLRDFAKLVLDKSGIKIFKDQFYEGSMPSTKRR